jgi:hypothetical protein
MGTELEAGTELGMELRRAMPGFGIDACGIEVAMTTLDIRVECESDSDSVAEALCWRLTPA